MCALLLSLLLPASADTPINMFGGRTVDRPGLALSAGMPSAISLDVRLPTGTVDLGLGATFDWANHAANINPSTGILFDARIPVFAKDDWNVAIRLGTRIHLFFVNGTALSIDMGNPAALATVALSDKIDVNMGLEVRPSLVLAPGAGVSSVTVAVPLHAGVEADVGGGVRVGGTIAGGPNFAAVGNFVGVGPWLDVRVFVGFAL